MVDALKTEKLDTMMVRIETKGQIKGNVETMTHDEVEEQAKRARKSLRLVKPGTRGTCVEDRTRAGTRAQVASLEAEAVQVEPRPSVQGGPDVYGTYMAELAGKYIGSSLKSKVRIKETKDIINKAKFPSGAHDRCAADEKMEAVLTLIAENPEYVKDYARANMGDTYNDELANEVIANAALSAPVYADHKAEDISEIYGNEASDAIEVVIGEHEGRTVVRNDVRDYTVHQNSVHELSEQETGRPEDSFVFDEWYADDIETAVAAGPEAKRQKQLMEHGREFLLAAVAAAVPNQELHQINLSM